jgi:hypothetical protein
VLRWYQARLGCACTCVRSRRGTMRATPGRHSQCALPGPPVADAAAAGGAR